MTTEQFTTIAEVESIAARAGIELTPNDYAAAYAVAEQRRAKRDLGLAASTPFCCVCSGR